MAGNPIPTKRRQQVRARESGRCLRCGAPAHEWHHRRRRNVRDEHQHCPCNGVLLCATCHRWAHSDKDGSRLTGFTVSATSTNPSLVQVTCRLGMVVLTCTGTYENGDSHGNEGTTGAGAHH